MFNWFWKLVFWWKKRTGWLDFGQEITGTGTVIRVDPPGTDGDGNFDLLLDSGQEYLITGFGRRTACPPVTAPSLHCEIEPWADQELLDQFAKLKVGDRVRVTGEWGFDGVHLGVWMPLEALAGFFRHQPNTRDGWFECHPVTKLEIL